MSAVSNGTSECTSPAFKIISPLHSRYAVQIDTANGLSSERRIVTVCRASPPFIKQVLPDTAATAAIRHLISRFWRSLVSWPLGCSNQARTCIYREARIICLISRHS
jgi:hypothetical protein